MRDPDQWVGSSSTRVQTQPSLRAEAGWLAGTKSTWPAAAWLPIRHYNSQCTISIIRNNEITRPSWTTNCINRGVLVRVCFFECGANIQLQCDTYPGISLLIRLTMFWWKLVAWGLCIHFHKLSTEGQRRKPYQKPPTCQVILIKDRDTRPLVITEL